MASTMATYLDQLSVSARPGTVAAFEIALRFFAGRVTEADRWCVSVADIERRHIEDFKLWQARRPGKQREEALDHHHPPPAGAAAHLLRADHRVGL